MKKLVWISLLFTLTTTPSLADTAEDLARWFKEGYAALYLENAWDRADEFAQYFADRIEYRTDDGLDVTDVNDFVVNSLDGWRSEGWLGTDVAALSTTPLNATTVVFDVRWRDRYDDGSTEDSCGWYVADKVGGKWLLSQYIATACGE